ncbi:UDP-N-acetylglucosamine 2-epimerase (non-hydrolysing) [Salegentibacter sp. 24]|uniref:non-hydrolyzing UDP-N-acetylglucosamine 2-epimerase n=1 Tax=Salegentibacter sp. 24 TaxID=2183986 RepID=UPI00105E64AC|nr:UDP-N-acetylglucosamine 2-epimerase (non-hydrolyzing) [Salegentibacter sp. 24]TDN89158.1 UDP-N-acetylglucosamine 2-epimerase (non-hydrolysing) [Salegentibacter sp. 24]
MKIDLIAGARPNFVKIAAIIHAIEKSEHPIKYRLIHTGQHYDESLSGNFFRDLSIPKPDINLEVGSGSQAAQTGAIMIAYEKILINEKPGLCLVVGDVNSSMACAITAKKMQVKVAHVEAGLRSFDWNMPEEINRILIDSISDYCFTTTLEAKQLLLNTGKEEDNTFFVGNTMIDTLLNFRNKFRRPSIWEKLKLTEGNYIILTLHRPGNVDEIKNLEITIKTILDHSRNLPVIFPVHPRTANILKLSTCQNENLYIVEPLSYLEFNYMVERAKAVITDSGGITEETTVLGVPCLSVRNSTERPETINEGTNELLGTDPLTIAPTLEKLFNGKWKKGKIPESWDGKTGGRIIKILNRLSFCF